MEYEAGWNSLFTFRLQEYESSGQISNQQDDQNILYATFKLL